MPIIRGRTQDSAGSRTLGLHQYRDGTTSTGTPNINLHFRTSRTQVQYIRTPAPPPVLASVDTLVATGPHSNTCEITFMNSAAEDGELPVAST